ncbi:hypothetical protein Pyn_16962 [Prunus yedoensis var. nudiflora]|uniref:Uncharacterized protein n=1 Tax=Prunus yedoensis var. nudiflora TaxID=2094558 RepID=A0A314YBT4_PRUYE|nr:hypothetical protein Pyn_16962 [Prunus yedoensis var. nudiflora]
MILLRTYAKRATLIGTSPDVGQTGHTLIDTSPDVGQMGYTLTDTSPDIGRTDHTLIDTSPDVGQTCHTHRHVFGCRPNGSLSSTSLRT